MSEHADRVDGDGDLADGTIHRLGGAAWFTDSLAIIQVLVQVDADLLRLDDERRTWLHIGGEERQPERAS